MDKAQAPIQANEPAVQAMPGPLPRPPGRPPAEPIVIRTPPRPREDVEIERPDDMDEDKSVEIERPDDMDEDKSGEIRRPPPWVPDQPPPAPPEERAIRSRQ